MLKNIILFIILCVGTYYSYYYFIESGRIYDYSKINFVNDMILYKPNNINELQIFLRKNTKPFCILGAGYSFGGHTLLENGLQINMENINNIHYHNNSLITVGSGCTWFDITKYLLNHNRTIAVCQSYFNFSVGGSISVNCHGRDIEYGSIANTVMSLKIMLSNGNIILCDRTTNYELFRGIIGGYGLLGIIIEATLITTLNFKIKCIITKSNSIPSNMSNNNIIFYNANIYPTKMDDIYNYYWIKTNEYPTNFNLLKNTNQNYFMIKFFEQILRISSLFKNFRANIEPYIHNDRIHYKSYEIGDDAKQHQPFMKHPNTSLLQEYFIPKENINFFLISLKKYIYFVNILNISIRFVKKNCDSVINHTPVDSYSVVLYFTVINNSLFLDNLYIFTNIMIDETIKLNGKVYLPYLRSYSIKKIKKIYSNDFSKIIKLKKKYDPEHKIINEWYKNIFLQK